MKTQFALSLLVVLSAASADAQETQMYAPPAMAQPYADASIQPVQPRPLSDTPRRDTSSFLQMVAEEQEGIAHGKRVTSSRRLMKLSGL